MSSARRGKVVAHNLSYDGCSVHRELQREALQVNVFEEAMKRGICTTQPKVAKWCKKELGEKLPVSDDYLFPPSLSKLYRHF